MGQAEDGSVSSPNDIEVHQAKKFLRKLARKPFIAVVFDGQEPRFYTKGVDRETIALLESLLAESGVTPD